MKKLKRITSLCMAAVMLFSVSSLSAFAAPGSESSTSTTLNWTQFLGNEELKGVSDAKTPKTGAEIKELWRSQHKGNIMNNASPTVAVGDSIYYYETDPDISYTSSSNRTLYKVKASTGEVEASSVEIPSNGQLLPQICYGNGKVFVFGTETGGSRIYAFDAVTLKMLFKTALIPSAQIESAIMYHDGYIYAGSYNANGEFACFDTEDTDPQNTDEEKTAKWSYNVGADAGQGILWDGAEFVGDAVIFGTAAGKLISLNRFTGAEIDVLSKPKGEDAGFTTTPYYYEKNNMLYVSMAESNSGVIAVPMNSDGSFDDDNILMYKNSGGIKSSVVIYNDRVYVCGGGGHGGGNAPFTVLDANTLEEIYTIPDLISKGSAVLTTAYATKENNQQVYLYITPYKPAGTYPDRTSQLYIIKDSIGQTEPDYEIVDMGDKTVGQYSSQTYTINKDGLLSIYNDANYVYCYGNVDETAQIINGTDVYNQIARQPDTNEFKYYNEFELRRIQERYNNLSAEEQAKVTNIDKLTEMLAVANMLPEERLDELNDAIASLPETSEITLDQAETIESLYNTYLSMTDEAKQNVVGADKLAAAYTSVQELRNAAATEALVNEINALPLEQELTLSDETQIDNLLQRLEALPAEYAALVANADKLNAAKARMTDIHTRIAGLEGFIDQNLAAAEITLDSKAMLDEALAWAEGIPAADLESVSRYGQYLLPAVTDYVNLLIDALYQDGKPVELTGENIAEVKETLAEIQKYYGLLPESEQRYVEHYDTVTALEEEAEQYVPNSEKPEQKPETTEPVAGDTLPATGDTLPVWSLAAVMLLAFAGFAAIAIKRTSK